ncbi:PadR family transcriptional regulator [Sphaerisporangium album]|uniref:PadR family transcriptional regulator n=1 Tax=Sphaerisporangium album TaxID=509200 RepID=A0A367FMG5_9ACTN|nr:PadR family transcriptional regulator [Sphaerisporangium album]RCG30805.1 PadR family transcriptional regulator [Sphaerisporangium album]
MSSTRALILGVLLDGPMHGYKVRQTLELWGAQYWANVAFGSIYHGLGQMAKEGLLRVVVSGKGGQTVYEITDEGRQEFQRMLNDFWWDLKPIVDPFQVALTFMDRMPKADLLAALTARRGRLQAALLMSERALAGKRAHGAPRHIDETVFLAALQLRAQLEWLEQAIEKAEKGDLP